MSDRTEAALSALALVLSIVAAALAGAGSGVSWSPT